MKANLSILGLYQYDPTIFDLLQLPDGINKQTVIDNICFECAEFEVLYGRPATMKAAIGVWSVKSMHAWTRMYQALMEDYNPLHNYDRHEDWTDANTSTNSTTSSANASATNNDTTSVNGFNNDTMKPSSANAGTNSQTSSGNASGQSSDNASHSGHLYGNIGVTTSATMLTEELETRSKYNIVDIITNDFKKRFTLLIY